jgi:hypothetical protein
VPQTRGPVPMDPVYRSIDLFYGFSFRKINSEF